MRNGCYLSLNPNNAGTAGTGRRRAGAIDGTLATVPALSALLTLLLAVAAVAVAMNHTVAVATIWWRSSKRWGQGEPTA